jgi:hypothetical protein
VQHTLLFAEVRNQQAQIAIITSMQIGATAHNVRINVDHAFLVLVDSHQMKTVYLVFPEVGYQVANVVVPEIAELLKLNVS